MKSRGQPAEGTTAAAAHGSFSGTKLGYHFRKVAGSSPLITFVRVCSSSGPSRRCCRTRWSRSRPSVKETLMLDDHPHTRLRDAKDALSFAADLRRLMDA
jgi:hypothetical protein